jgi:hypothetical protein
METTYEELIKLFRLTDQRQVKVGLVGKITVVENGIVVTDEKLKELIAKGRATTVLTIDELSKRCGVSKRRLTDLSRDGVISSYRLSNKNKKGSKFLFFESDIREEQCLIISFQKKCNYPRLGDLLHGIMSKQLCLTEKESELIRLRYFNFMSMEDIASQYNTSYEMVGFIINGGLKKLLNSARYNFSYLNEQEDYRKKYIALSRQYNDVCVKLKSFMSDEDALKLQSESLKSANPILAELNLSVRALNLLKAAEIKTLTDLLTYKKKDLMKYRNYGKTTLSELEKMVESYGCIWD